MAELTPSQTIISTSVYFLFVLIVINTEVYKKNIIFILKTVKKMATYNGKDSINYSDRV